ncbi:ketoacyl-ACP synthase III family protein [Micromonospora sp. NPDC047557]|uniref:ketoacyl-ACP synthase III family protein n=1 Tax=Micromonospora sp. NPDC047557 TaxID=3364250 RepID=UPI0037150BE5
MRTDLAVTGVATWIPESVAVPDDAVTAGRIDAESAADLGVRELPEASLAPPDMAVLAARRALRSAGVDHGAVGLLLHAWIYHQGHDLWSAPHYVARELGLTAAVPLGLQQICNGGAAGIEMAAARLMVEPELGHALVTTADRFAEPGFDRWGGDYGIAYGDGATALVLRQRGDGPAPLVLRAVRTAAAVDLESMHRGEDVFSPAPRWHSPSVDIRRTKKAFLRQHGIGGFAAVSREKIHDVLGGSLRDAGITPDDPRLRYVALPRLGRKVLREAYVPAVAEVTPAEPLDLAATTGHLGAGDVAANLAAVAGRLAPGEVAVLLSAGAGFTWSSVVLHRPG